MRDGKVTTAKAMAYSAPDSFRRPLPLLLACAMGFYSFLAAAPALAGDVPFGGQTVITSAADGARGIYVGDLDGDGDLDVVSASAVNDTIAWYQNDGSNPPSFLTIATTTISTAADGARAVFTADLDGDGDLDVISASETDDKIAWYKNDPADTGTKGDFGGELVLSTAADGASGVFAADLDGDGDLDVVSASFNDDKVAWYENDGTDTFAGQTVISTAADGARSVFAVDVDRDGDPDVLVASELDDEIAWYENRLNDGVHNDFNATPNVISSTANGAQSVFAADVDGDGDMDVLSASEIDNRVAWYENDPGDTGTKGTFGVAQNITAAATGARSVFAMDMDADGDLDALSASGGNNDINWYENVSGDGSSWTTRTIFGAATNAAGVFAADLDGDGDMDAASVSENDDKVAWYANAFIHRSAVFPEQNTISTLANGAWAVFAADLDRDGDLDALSASRVDSEIAWYENTDGAGTFGGQTIVDTNASGARDVEAADVDGDGDLDILSAALLDDTIGWYENTDGAGTFGVEQAITTVADGAQAVHAADLDRDGDIDVLSASSADNKIAWYENTSGDASAWTAHTISTVVMGARDVYSADLDDDGDLDVVSASESDDTIAWFENTDGAGTFGLQQVISTNANSARSVFAADVDGDGDMDVLSASAIDDKIAWYENTSGDGSAWTERVITTSADSARSVKATDMDGDGDMDVLSASAGGNEVIAWYANDGSTPPNWTKVGATSVDSGARMVAVGDVDGDGDMDVLSASSGDDRIAWYPSKGGHFALPTVDTAALFILESDEDDLLKIDATHRGRTGDTDVELVTFDLLFEETAGDPLLSAEANALIANLHIYLDDGSGVFEALSDTLVTTVGSLSLTAGVQTVSFIDNDPNVEVVFGTSRTYFVVAEMTANASSQVPTIFRMTHLTETTGTGEDQDNDIPLVLEFAQNVSSSRSLASCPTCDFDNDGLLDTVETNTGNFVSSSDTGTDPLNPDSDGDNLLDGVETGTGTFVDANDTGTDPNDTDSDNDGLQDDVETGTGIFVDPSNTGSDPNIKDTDGDGFNDGDEVLAGTDPNDRFDPMPVPALGPWGVGLFLLLLAAGAGWRRKRGAY